MKLDATCPASDLWRYEVRKGVRSITTFDALWNAACEEMAAGEFIAAGLPDVAAGCFRRAYDAMTERAA